MNLASGAEEDAPPSASLPSPEATGPELVSELVDSLYHERTILGVDPADLPPAPPPQPPAPQEGFDVLFPADYQRNLAETSPASRTILELRERTAERQSAARRLREEMASLREQAARLRAGATPPPATPPPPVEDPAEALDVEPSDDEEPEYTDGHTDEQAAVEEGDATSGGRTRRRWRRQERKRGNE
jgi:hypothetical protein